MKDINKNHSRLSHIVTVVELYLESQIGWYLLLLCYYLKHFYILKIMTKKLDKNRKYYDKVVFN